MNKEKLLEKMSNLNQNTMATAIGLELTDIGNDYVCGKIALFSFTSDSRRIFNLA